MKSKKLTLDQLKIKSFVTGISDHQRATVHGGKQNITFECSFGRDTLDVRCESSELGCA